MQYTPRARQCDSDQCAYMYVRHTQKMRVTVPRSSKNFASTATHHACRICACAFRCMCFSGSTRSTRHFSLRSRRSSHPLFLLNYSISCVVHVHVHVHLGLLKTAHISRTRLAELAIDPHGSMRHGRSQTVTMCAINTHA